MSRENIIWLALRGILLMLVGPLVMSCATATPPVAYQQPQETKSTSVLETCAVVQDQDLAEMRGCYDVYSFGMSIKGDIDLAMKNFSITTNYTQITDAAKNSSQTPSQVTVNSTGTQVNFSNGNVAYTAGMGQNSLGTGIMQVIQVAGSNVIVMANMDVTLNINNAVNVKPVAGNTLNSGALSGLFR